MYHGFDAVSKSTIDDEYANATKKDPKILLTTSGNPSAPLTQFVKKISKIIDTCRAHDFTDVILVHEHHGVLDDIIISHLPFSPSDYFGLLSVVTRHDIKDRKTIGTMPEAYPHLISTTFQLRHHIYEKHGDPKSIELKEVRPRFELRFYQIFLMLQIKLGTMDQDEAQIECVIRPYKNTPKKQNRLGD